eukprot:SAG31_NODE_4410_length_3255_cov_1.558935_4_plen_117_part_00
MRCLGPSTQIASNASFGKTILAEGPQTLPHAWDPEVAAVVDVRHRHRRTHQTIPAPRPRRGRGQNAQRALMALLRVGLQLHVRTCAQIVAPVSLEPAATVIRVVPAPSKTRLGPAV